MRGKARENQEVGLRALADGCFNAAANRLYYAVFQAAVYALERGGRRPSDFRRTARHWDHRMIGDRVALIRGRPEEARLFGNLRRIRMRADYEKDRVQRRDVEPMKQGIVRLVPELTS